MPGRGQSAREGLSRWTRTPRALNRRLRGATVGIGARTWITGAVGFLLVAGLFAAFLFAIASQRAASERARRSIEVIAAANRLERLAIDLETGVRGFLVAGQERFLEPFEAARIAFPREAGRLEELVADSSSEVSVARGIERSGLSFITDWTERVITVAKTDLSEARALLDEGKRRVDAMRAQFERLIVAERTVAQEREDTARAAANLAIGLGGAGLGLTLALVLLSAGHIRRSVVVPVRRLAAAASRMGAGDLTVEVPVTRRDEVGDLGRVFNAMAAALAEARDGRERALSDAGTRAHLLQVVIEATPDAICVVDLDGNVLIANQPMDELEEVFLLPTQGSLLDGARVLAERVSDPVGFLESFEAIVADPERLATDEYELAESERTFLRYTAPIHDDAGVTVARIFAVRELTAEREADRLKSELLATVSHELRTPLTSIVSFAELLATRDLDAPTRHRYYDVLHGESQRLMKLVNDFLDFQRIERGHFDVIREPFELGPLLNEKVAIYAGQSAMHDLELHLPDEALVAMGERERIGQVIGNLLSNAIKYSPRGGPVTVTAEAVDGTVRVSVVDLGVGIPAVYHERVFSRFFRIDSPEGRRAGGAGLGLALCREIVSMHGGRIGVESTLGEGSIFWFELPLPEGATL